MKGFKHTGRGPKSGHSFSSKAGFTGSTGRTQSVRGYTRATPKPKFAGGGVVKMADAGSAVVRRDQPVTQFDAQHGGKTPLRPGFNKGGACFAEGGKVDVAKKIVDKTPLKQMMMKPHDIRTSKKTAYYMKSDEGRESKVMSDLVQAGREDKPKFGLGGMVGRSKAQVMTGAGGTGRAAPGRVQVAPPATAPIKGARPLPPAPQAQKVPMGRVSNHGYYGSFSQNPAIK